MTSNPSNLMGNPPEAFLCQDLCSPLSKWLSTRMAARQHLYKTSRTSSTQGISSNKKNTTHQNTQRT